MPDAHRRHQLAHRVVRDALLLHEKRERLVQRHAGAGHRRGARAAVGLDHVAVEHDGALAEALQIDHRPQGTPDQALDLQRAAALPSLRGLARDAAGGGAGQHAVLRGHPPAARALEKGRHLVLHGGRAEHHGSAHGDARRALGVAQHADLDRGGTELVETAAVASGHRVSSRRAAPAQRSYQGRSDWSTASTFPRPASPRNRRPSA